MGGHKGRRVQAGGAGQAGCWVHFPHAHAGASTGACMPLPACLRATCACGALR